MTDARRPTFLRNFGRGTPARRAPELADMGTAFALDQALDQAGSADPQAPARRAFPLGAWRLWLGRKPGA